MTFPQTTLTAMNQRHRAFWAEQRLFTDSLLKDEVLHKHAASSLKAEVMRGTPTRSQNTLEQALRDAFALRQELEPEIRSKTRREQARLAGSAKKTDRLQELIVALVREDPRLTASQLKDRLEGLKRQPGPLAYVVVEDFDDENICFLRKDGKGDSAPISRLKDRLSRAKKKLVAQTR